MNAASTPAQAPQLPAEVKPLYVTVFIIPIVGASGTIQSRSLVFCRPPTKEVAIETLHGIHRDSQGRPGYCGEWQRCAETLAQVSEEMFSQMNQRRSRKITCMVKVTTPDGNTTPRLFSARSCFVHGWSRDQIDRLL